MNTNKGKEEQHEPWCKGNCLGCGSGQLSVTTDQNIDWEEEFIENGASLEHVRWARWQNYLHSFLVWNNDIQMWTLPHEKKEWWDSEIRTPYNMLNEAQKESDRKEVREYLPLIKSLLSKKDEERETAVRQERERVLRGVLERIQEDVNFGAEHQQLVSTKAQAYVLTQLSLNDSTE